MSYDDLHDQEICIAESVKATYSTQRDNNFESLPFIRAFKNSVLSGTNPSAVISGLKERVERQNSLMNLAQTNKSDPDAQTLSRFEQFSIRDEFSTERRSPEPKPDAFELISLGMDEPLPPKHITDTLHEIFFNGFCRSYPFLCKQRYLTSMGHPPPLQPYIFLRYAIWTVAAASSKQYRQYTSIFYQRARKYLERHTTNERNIAASMVAYVQAWIIISQYEYGAMQFPRAWISVGVACRTVSMLQLHCIDAHIVGVKQCLPPAKDWIEIEERRRTFWAAMIMDRYASICTGWPMILDELDVQTNLPANELNYQQGISETTCSITSAMNPSSCKYIKNMSPFCSKVVVTMMLGRVYRHLHRGDNGTSEYLAKHSDFFERFRVLNNMIHTFVLLLPNDLKQPSGGESSLQVAQLHMTIHSTLICLHQATVVRGSQSPKLQEEVDSSTSKCLQSAAEITRVIQNISHIESALLDPYQAFCIYIGARCFIHALGTSPLIVNESAKAQLDFLLTALDNMKEDVIIAQSFLLQLEIDMANLFSEDDKVTAEDTVRSSSSDAASASVYPTDSMPISEATSTFSPESPASRDTTNAECSYPTSQFRRPDSPNSPDTFEAPKGDRPLQSPYFGLPDRSNDALDIPHATTNSSFSQMQHSTTVMMQSEMPNELIDGRDRDISIEFNHRTAAASQALFDQRMNQVNELGLSEKVLQHQPQQINARNDQTSLLSVLKNSKTMMMEQRRRAQIAAAAAEAPQAHGLSPDFDMLNEMPPGDHMQLDGGQQFLNVENLLSSEFSLGLDDTEMASGELMWDTSETIMDDTLGKLFKNSGLQ